MQPAIEVPPAAAAGEHAVPESAPTMSAAEPTTSSAQAPVTVILLTLNEEENLPGALESVRGWAQEIFVVDSCSADRTVDAALAGGARVVQRRFTNYGDQWNWALQRLPIATPWVLKLDADERVSPLLAREIGARLASHPGENGFLTRIRFWFLGQPLHAGLRTCRLWRLGKARFSPVVVNEHLLVDGQVGQLSEWIEHMDCPDLHRWYDKQNRYTTMEAIMRVRGDALAARPHLLGSALERRMFLKTLARVLPFRYQALFFYHLLACGVWRDGATGWAWARLRTELHRAVELKTAEIRRTGRVPDLPRAPHGDFDPRVLSTPLQQAAAGEGTA